MVPLLSLWLPILLSAVLVFIVSSIVHMVMPHHKSDYAKLSSEEAVMDALRPFAIPPDDYIMPKPASVSDMKSKEYQDKLTRGPVMIMTVMPNGVRGMTSSLVQWFLYLTVVAILAAWVAGRVLAPGTPYLDVFAIVAAIAFGAYSLGLLQNSIWYARKWSTTIKSVADGLVYALLTAGVFGWLWPK